MTESEHPREGTSRPAEQSWLSWVTASESAEQEPDSAMFSEPVDRVDDDPHEPQAVVEDDELSPVPAVSSPRPQRVFDGRKIALWGLLAVLVCVVVFSVVVLTRGIQNAARSSSPPVTSSSSEPSVLETPSVETSESQSPTSTTAVAVSESGECDELKDVDAGSPEGVIREFFAGYFTNDADTITAVSARDSYLRNTDWSTILPGQVADRWCVKFTVRQPMVVDAFATTVLRSGEEKLYSHRFHLVKQGDVYVIDKIDEI